MGTAVMRLLLDTHALLWWLFDDPKLSETARAAMAMPSSEVLVSAASAWEIATKHRIGKLPEAGDVAADLPRYLLEARFSALEISVEHALLAGSLVGQHRDPFDRMLIAPARLLGAPIVTMDPVFRDFHVPII